MTARVIVSGRTSSRVDVPVAPLGTLIPPTFSGDRLHNSEGFAWWVSQHYALKTDYPEERARQLLTLLELAYPHYVALFGREPEGIAGKRLAICYAASKESLDRALKDDGITWDFGGGGITYEGINCAYCYPSGSLQYHQRYILLHEGVHQFQQALVGACRVTPGWYYEGVGELFASHVLEGDYARLTVSVFDKATTHNWLDEGLAELARTGLTPSVVHERGGADRGMGFLLTTFLSNTPEREAKLTVWRDELHRLRLYGENTKVSSGVLQDLYGPWEQIDREFAEWTRTLRSTFHYAEWGWEQDGNTLWSYGFAPEGRLSQTDVNLPPGEAVQYSPFRTDYPAEPQSPLVSEVHSGVPEPSVGCLLDFSRNPGRGVAGIGLGVVAPGPESSAPGSLRVLVDQEQTLVLDGSDLGLPVDRSPLPDDFRAAMASSGHRLGLTVTIVADRLALDLRALAAGAGEPLLLSHEYPIDEPARQRVLSRPFTVLARDGYHGVTPYAETARRPEPDLSTPAPANRWRNPGQARLCAVVGASWRLGAQAPALLAALRQQLVASSEDRATHLAAVTAYDEALPRLLEAIDTSGAPDEAKSLARQVLLEAAGRAP